MPQSKVLRLWPLLLIGVGIALLLDNFLLLGDFNVVALLPLLLVVAGAQILLGGDLLTNSEGRTFGITRGSVESAVLEASSGAVDVEIRALQREGRLIAGQYAAQSRPLLDVTGTHAQIQMKRSRTPWLSFADWQVALAQDLPWQLFISTHLGKATVDLSDVIIQDAVIATGLGEIRLTSPPEALGRVELRSAVGNIHITTPPGYNTHIYIEAGRLFGVQADEYRYENPESGIYIAANADENAPLVEIYISGTFGDAYLA